MPTPDSRDLWKYAGLGAQIFASIGVAVYLGHLADKHILQFRVPVATITLPLVVISAIIYSIIKETSKKK